MGGVTGDFAKLARLKKAIGSMASPEPRTKLSQRLAVTALKLASDGFRRSVDPYDKPWKGVQRNRKRDRMARRRREARGLPVKADKPLIDTGRLRAAFAPKHARVSAHGFRILIPVEYASFHQDGTSRIAQRRMLPSAGPLPPRWRKAFETETRKVLAEHFKDVR